jgi:hypothetical protein
MEDPLKKSTSETYTSVDLSSRGDNFVLDLYYSVLLGILDRFAIQYTLPSFVQHTRNNFE